MPVSSVTEHWIKPDAVTINLNHFGDPDYLQVSVLAGAVVMAFKQDVIAYNAAHNYRTWPLQAANTYLETTSAYNVYARLTRSEVNASALIVYDPILRDIEGRPISLSENGEEVLGDADSTYFYVFLGQISSSIESSGQSTSREWIVDFRFGQLNTSEQLNDVNALLFKLFTPHFEDPLDPSKLTWIEAKSHIGVNGGVTMFVANDDIDLPVIYDGLPIDGQTLVWEETSDGKILKINPNIDLGGTSSWSELEGKPSWITDSKPIYNYSEIKNTPDLSVFVTGTALNKTLADYATLTYLTGELKNYVSLDGAQDITGVKDFINGLKIGGLPITKKQDDVVYLDANLVVRGGITMYGDGEGDSSVPSYSTLGSLLNVDESNDSVASVDRVLFQSAGSNVWSWKPLSEIGGGSSGGSVSGNYLPLSGGTINGNSGLDLIINTSYSEYNLIGFQQNNTYKGYVGVESDGGIGMYSYVSRSYLGINSSGEPYVQNDKLNQIYTILHAGNYSTYALPLSGGEINGSLQISNGSLALLGSKNSGASTISFDSNGDSYSSITVSRYGIDYNGVLSICPKGGMVGVGLTNPEYKFHVQGDIYSSGMVIANSGIEARGTSSYGSLPYIRLHIPGVTYAQFLLNSNGVVELRYGDNTQTGRFMNFSSGDILSSGGITMYSDQRKKTILNHVELSLKQIANAPLIEHYYNSDQEKTTHVGSIAQYWAGLNDWFCKLDNEGYYTMEIQNAALASAISIARELVKYESKTDRTIRKMKKRIQELEDQLEKLEGGNYVS